MTHRIRIVAISVLCATAQVLSAQPDDNSTMPYVQMATVVEKYSATLAPHVTMSPIIRSEAPQTGEQRQLYFVIHAKRGDLRVPVASDGTFAFPVKKDLIQENPPVSLHGADGGGSFSIVAQFKKSPAGEKEEIPYSEIMLPYTHGVEMQKQAKRRNPRVPEPKVLEAQILIVNGPSDPLVIRSSKGNIELQQSQQGEFRVPFDASMLSENPMVVFPTNAVTLGRFVFADSSEIAPQGKTGESEQEN